MLLRSRIAAATVTIGALALAAPIAASNAGTIDATVKSRGVVPASASIAANLPIDLQAIIDGDHEGHHAGESGWDAGGHGVTHGWHDEDAGINASATLLGLHLALGLEL
jgi:hypothetical protein